MEDRQATRLCLYDHDPIILIENVPAVVCRHCGESVYSDATAKVLEYLLRDRRQPSRLMDVCVYDFEKVIP